MHFDLIQSIGLAGKANTPNDDRAGAGDTLAWVIDGATDLGEPGLVGPRGGSAWIAMAAHQAFTAAPEAPIAETCRAVIAGVATAYAAERRRDPIAAWELPAASFLAARLDQGGLAAGWMGDCTGLLRRGGTVHRIGEPRRKRDAERASAARFVGQGLGTSRSGAILETLRASRSRPGRGILTVAGLGGPMPVFATLPCAAGDELLLMSDGFAALVDAYDWYDEAGLFAAVDAEGLAALALRLRAIEAEDAACERFPRFKASDDATALWLRIAG